MKKILFISALLLLVIISNAQIKVAVIAISANERLYTEGFTDPIVNSRSDDFYMGLDFDINDELTNFKSYLFDDLSKEFPFQLVPESEIINDEDFVTFRNEFIESPIGQMINRLYLDGYTHQQALFKKLTIQICDMFDNVDGLIIVQLDYSIAPKVMVGVNGAAAGKAKASIALFHKSGKRIMNIVQAGMSESSLKVIAGQIVSNYDEIPITLVEASEQLKVEIQNDLPKAVEKLNKKLSKL